MKLEFPGSERRPIVAMEYLRKKSASRRGSDSSTSNASDELSGLVVLTLGSAWFFQRINSTPEFKAHDLGLRGVFWSVRIHKETRTVMISTKPAPLCRHIAGDLQRVAISEDDWTVRLNVIAETAGGSFQQRSFLRSALSTHPCNDDRILAIIGKGSTNSDHRLAVHEIGASKKVLQEVLIGKAVLDVLPFRFNGQNFVAVLTESDVILYKWRMWAESHLNQWKDQH